MDTSRKDSVSANVTLKLGNNSLSLKEGNDL